MDVDTVSRRSFAKLSAQIETKRKENPKMLVSFNAGASFKHQIPFESDLSAFLNLDTLRRVKDYKFKYQEPLKILASSSVSGT